jgi:hypothetical protein
VKRGQIITGRHKLAGELGLSEQQIRTALDNLLSTGEITSQPTSRFSIITISEYNLYREDATTSNQPDNQQITNPATNKQPTDNQQITTTKEGKERKEGKEEKEYTSDSQEMRLSRLLFEKMKMNNNDVLEPNFQAWAKEVDKMIRIDNRPPERIEQAIRWAQADDFEKNNIKSTSKLRKRFSDITGKMGTTGKTGKEITTPYHGEKLSF